MILFFLSSPPAAGIEYEVVLQGVEDKDMQKAIREDALLYQLADRDPLTVAGLRRRARNDISTIETLLNEQGFFGAAAGFEIDEAGAMPVVNLRIEAGPQYRLGDLEVRWMRRRPDIDITTDFQPGLIAQPEAVLAAEQEIMTRLMQEGYPFPNVAARRLVVDHDRHLVDAVLYIDAGNLAWFGPVEIAGLEDVETGFIRAQVTWEEGALFDIREVAATRRNLLNSGVVAAVDINYEPPPEGGVIPVTLDVEERKHRSIGAGVSYSTTREFVAQVFWEHRNLFGQAEKLRTRLELGTKTYGLTADFSKPDIFSVRDLDWQLSGEIRQEVLEAYEKESVAVSSTFSYALAEHSSVSAGVWLEESRIREEGEEEENFTVTGLPLVYKFDNTDNLLNPREGVRFAAGITPFYVINEQADFYKFDLDGSHYWPFGDRFVWANRARAAVIEGQPLVDLPPDLRLYAGGGGSLRGYGYQMAGPLDENNNPLGGRTVLELGTEGRFMVTEDIEAVGFFEAARVTASTNFDSDEEFLTSVGVGGRYHTAVGPVRIDIAVPLNKRAVDDAFQFYISLGQAF